MFQPKRGDVVLYSQGGRTYNALVLALSLLNDSHLGENDEPALHLAVLFDDPKVVQFGSIPEPTVVHDVVHASHEFDAAYMEQHGLRRLPDGDPQKVAAEAELRNRRGAGEWSEATVVKDLLGRGRDLVEVAAEPPAPSTETTVAGLTPASDAPDQGAKE